MKQTKSRTREACLWDWRCDGHRHGTGRCAGAGRGRAPPACRTSPVPSPHRWHWWRCEHCWPGSEWQETGLERNNVCQPHCKACKVGILTTVLLLFHSTSGCFMLRNTRVCKPTLPVTKPSLAK